jgi:hypothetical protein
VNRTAPFFVLVLVTALLRAYGAHPWSWLAGPIAALALLSLDRKARETEASASARARREPAPVD